MKIKYVEWIVQFSDYTIIVNLPISKRVLVVQVEEEMAWQVAEMVVKDVIDLTMGCNGETDWVEKDWSLH